jgi:hypothetical protein
MSDSNELRSPSESGRKKGNVSKRKKNLEFDFANGDAGAAHIELGNDRPHPSESSQANDSRPVGASSAQHRYVRVNPPIQGEDNTPKSGTPGTPRTEPVARGSTTRIPAPNSFSNSKDSPLHPNPNNMSTPTFSTFQQNVQRQAREQKAVGSILSGVVVVIFSLIIICAGLAGYGGYILHKQIGEQSVSIDQLETKMVANVDLLQSSLKETVAAVDALNAQSQAQKQQITWLQSQLESIRSQASKDRAAQDSRIKKMDARLYDLERKVQE